MTARGLLIRLAHRTGLPDRLARRCLRRDRFVLMFHGISSARRPDLPSSAQPFLDASDLARILEWLSGRCDLLSPDDLLSDGRPGVLLTFDDGYANNHAQALPLLVERRAPAVFFVTTRHVADPKDWLPSIRRETGKVWASTGEVPGAIARDLFDGLSIKQLRDCAAAEGLEIGSHTVGHSLMTTLDDATLKRELAESRRQLEDWTGQSVRLFAYPTGDYDRRVATATRDAGYRAAFVEDSRGLAPHPEFEIPRIGLYNSEPWYLAGKLSGLFRRPLPIGSQR